jgi:[Skp1-protein]-hydroxyproline N-acetylglucosaminyltransferase
VLIFLVSEGRVKEIFGHIGQITIMVVGDRGQEEVRCKGRGAVTKEESDLLKGQRERLKKLKGMTTTHPRILNSQTEIMVDHSSGVWVRRMLVWLSFGGVILLVWSLLLLSTLQTPLVLSPSSSSSFSLRSSRRLPSFRSTSNLNPSHSSPPSLDETKRNLTRFLATLHERFGYHISTGIVEGPEIWNEYFELTKETLIRWDDENQGRHYPNKNDGSIFVSIGTYRDPYCPMTLKSIYSQASQPEKIFIGLLQQNCFEKVCISGVLEGGVTTTQGTDVDCYEEFCKSPEGQVSQACVRGQVRLFNINESESLGPYMARYLASKFYQGEQYYLQIDSHSEFTRYWDAKLIQMMSLSQAARPVISTYPPDSQAKWKDSPGYRICDSEFAAEPIEDQIIRLSPSSPYSQQPRPPYSPFVAAGFLFTSGDVVYNVPFDPLLPWIFMGEEISMSARLWTAGYDLFAPTTNVLNHYYVRRHYPKYWETVNRFVLSPCIFLFRDPSGPFSSHTATSRPISTMTWSRSSSTE